LKQKIQLRLESDIMISWNRLVEIAESKLQHIAFFGISHIACLYPIMDLTCSPFTRRSDLTLWDTNMLFSHSSYDGTNSWDRALAVDLLTLMVRQRIPR
jgi:hypothetical protein